MPGSESDTKEVRSRVKSRRPRHGYAAAIRHEPFGAADDDQGKGKELK
jgi:hypothetical protein